MAKWIKADVTYLGKGSYRCRNKSFRANRVVPITNRSLRDYLKDYPFFAIQDKYAPREEESPDLETSKDSEKESKENTGKRAKKVRVKGD